MANQFVNLWKFLFSYLICESVANLPNFSEEVKNSLIFLKKGRTILYPTDTIWGIGCDATNEEAINRIFEVKQRTETKSMIILVDSIDRLLRYIKDFPLNAEELIEYSEKPLTIIYPNAQNLPKNLIADDGSIAIRVTKDPFCKELIARFGKPIVSTSANKSGKQAPVNFNAIEKDIVSVVDYVVNLRQNEKATNQPKPSSIIKLGMKGEFEIIRK